MTRNKHRTEMVALHGFAEEVLSEAANVREDYNHNAEVSELAERTVILCRDVTDLLWRLLDGKLYESK